MPNNDRIIVGIDVGTNKVCTIVAEADAGPGNRLNVLGVGAVASEGISKGMITDIHKASASIAHSLEAAERQSGCRILSAYVSISGNHISSSNSRGLVAVSNPDRIVGQDDVARAVDAARAMAIPAGRDVLHVIPRTYTVDGQDGIQNPIGLSGFRLDVETHVVTGANNVRENLVRCVQKADVEVDDLVLSPLASAEAVLTEQEKNMGVVLVDIGHGTTDVAIYADGSVWHSKVIPVGGWHLTNDLVIVFNIPYESAETLKLQYGMAIAPGSSRYAQREAKAASLGRVPSRNGLAAVSANGNGNGHGVPLPVDVLMATAAEEAGLEEGEMLEAETFEGNLRHISRDELNEVMAARLDQLFGMVGDEIRRSGYEGLLSAGMVLTGGVAQMSNIEALAAGKLRLPVRTGHPRRIGGLADVFDSPAYATSVGLILWGMKPNAVNLPVLEERNGNSKERGSSRSVLADWLNKFMPRG
ncbi:MAG: cell division protein FtsA [Chloroflexota bacterium]|nr:cell division protein FtsA [Chloroflexota bacterium]MDQ5867929.1 cell division protein FtsA [Chloroflexota bacterium]